MKIAIAIFGLVSMSMTVFAADCNKAVLEIAKLNLDSKAKAYGFEQSYISEGTLKKISQNEKSGAAMYSVVGSIYRADYSVLVGVDSSCSIETLKIQE